MAAVAVPNGRTMFNSIITHQNVYFILSVCADLITSSIDNHDHVAIKTGVIAVSDTCVPEAGAQHVVSASLERISIVNKHV